MRLPMVLSCMILACTAARAAPPEEAAQLFAAQRWPEAAAAYQAVVDHDPSDAPAWFRLARARAASGEAELALAALRGWIAAGGGSYTAAMAVAELASLRDWPEFTALIAPLQPCIAAEYRQFDFWLGHWNVESAASPGIVSESRISRTNGGCTVLERYRSPSGYEGSSLNFYDGERKVWHQTWIDNQGTPLYLEGGLSGAAMVLATTVDPQNAQRITWTPLADGRVRQHWESTDDGGKTWTTVFDGYYSRRAGP